jgi:hypothetical protein
MPDTVLPVMRTLLICDHVYINPSDKKTYLLGVHDAFYSKAFPMRTVPFDLYLSLTEIVRPFELRIRMIDVNEDREPIAEPPPIAVTATGGQDVFGAMMHFPGLNIPQPDVYKVEIFADNDFVADRPFRCYVRK